MSWVPTDNFRSPAALVRFLGTAIIGLTLDLVTKVWAFATLAVYADGRPIRAGAHAFIPGYLHFEVTTNEGAVFGLGEGKRWLFVAVSIAAIGFLTALFAKSGRQRFYQVILGMLLAGVLGNMYDRIRYGYVRDMIHALPRWPDLFPWIFNVADVLLCTGVALLVLHSIIVGTDDARQPALQGD
jgi:signal peptidase II